MLGRDGKRSPDLLRQGQPCCRTAKRRLCETRRTEDRRSSPRSLTLRTSEAKMRAGMSKHERGAMPCTLQPWVFGNARAHAVDRNDSARR